MACEILAGPFPIVDTVSGDAPIQVAERIACYYDDDVGLVSPRQDGRGNAIIQMDGSSYVRSYAPYASAMLLDYQHPGQYLKVQEVFGSYIGEWDKFATVRMRTAPVLSSGVDFLMCARMADRWLSFGIHGVSWRPLDLSADWVYELTYDTQTYNEITVSWSWGLVGYSFTEQDDIVCIGYDSGLAIFYNHVTKQIVKKYFTQTNKGLWYSPRFGVFIVMGFVNTEPRHHTLTIFHKDVRPYSISVPAAQGPILKGKTTVFRTRVLGSNGEPCVGEIVTWTLTGSGSLSALQSIANDDGYAEIRYAAPVDSAPSFDLSVEVRF